jgi:hypothetical protein
MNITLKHIEGTVTVTYALGSEETWISSCKCDDAYSVVDARWSALAYIYIRMVDRFVAEAMTMKAPLTDVEPCALLVIRCTHYLNYGDAENFRQEVKRRQPVLYNLLGRQTWSGYAARREVHRCICNLGTALCRADDAWITDIPSPHTINLLTLTHTNGQKEAGAESGAEAE